MSNNPCHLPPDLAGITIAKRIDKLGMRSSDTAQIFFEDVRVPAENIVGQEGMGFTYQMEQVGDRLGLAAYRDWFIIAGFREA